MIWWAPGANSMSISPKYLVLSKRPAYLVSWCSPITAQKPSWFILVDALEHALSLSMCILQSPWLMLAKIFFGVFKKTWGLLGTSISSSKSLRLVDSRSILYRWHTLIDAWMTFWCWNQLRLDRCRFAKIEREREKGLSRLHFNFKFLNFENLRFTPNSV